MEYLTAFREVLVFARIEENRLVPDKGFAPFITLQPPEEYIHQCIIGIIIMSIFGLIFLFLGIANLNTSIKG